MRPANGVGVATKGVFQGYALQQVDDKGRVAIPSSLRAALFARMPGGMDPKDALNFVLAIHECDRCLIGYDPAYAEQRFEQLETRALEQVGDDGVPRYDIIRAGMAAETLPFDGSGRFILPGFPRKRAQIGKFAFFFGVGRHFEIWDPAALIACDTASDVMKDAVRYFMEEKGEKL